MLYPANYCSTPKVGPSCTTTVFVVCVYSVYVCAMCECIKMKLNSSLPTQIWVQQKRGLMANKHQRTTVKQVGQIDYKEHIFYSFT